MQAGEEEAEHLSGEQVIAPKLIPDEVVEALIRNRFCTTEKAARAACAAMLNAWPGGAVCHYTIADTEGYEMVLPLPLPQENSNG